MKERPRQATVKMDTGISLETSVTKCLLTLHRVSVELTQ
jgi:hypothetical protein